MELVQPSSSSGLAHPGAGSRILIVSDAWFPQVNGVVRTMNTVTRELRAMGHEIHLITPDQFRTIPCPTYSEIRLALKPYRRVAETIRQLNPDHIHLSTEGPLGRAARRYCLRAGLPFTTAYHTRFPEYIETRIRIPVRFSYAFLRNFHKPAQAVMAPTPHIADDLRRRGFGNVVVWGRGVDTEMFRPVGKDYFGDLPRPIVLYVSRVSVEKNIHAFLDMEIEGTKIVVGDGPIMAQVKRKYPHVKFVGTLHGEDLVAAYSAADVFVFPSKSDTFGLVMLEANACGVPAAAYPVPGPLDVIQDGGAGVMREDLAMATREALKIDPAICRKWALKHTWRRIAEDFYNHLTPVRANLAAAELAAK